MLASQDQGRLDLKGAGKGKHREPSKQHANGERDVSFEAFSFQGFGTRLEDVGISDLLPT